MISIPGPSSPNAEHRKTDDRFQRVLDRIDAVHRQDPARTLVDGASVPSALVYASRMSHWLGRLDPAASMALQLAARAQHLGRWKMPRTSHPAGRSGYLAWRRAQAQAHAVAIGSIMVEEGYGADMVERVQALVRKQRLKADPETQALEDTACLLFLAHELDAFSAKHPREKVIYILRRTWKKMSPHGQAMAQASPLSENSASLVTEALGGEGSEK